MPKQNNKSKAAEARRSNIKTRGASVAEPAPAVKKVNPIQYMSRMMQRAMNTINNKIAELEDRIAVSSTPNGSTDTFVQRSTTNFQSLVQPGTPMLYHSVAQLPIEKPKFPAKGKHPVTFIEDLTAYLRKCAPGANEVIDTIIECLEGESRNWARIYKDRWTQFEDFKRDFLDTYWGEAEQNELRRKIVQNSWDGTQSMLGHFITLCGQAKMLTYPIQERQLIADIMSHYPKEIQYAWSVNNQSSILQATEFLRKLDNINKQTNFKHNNNAQTNVVQKPTADVQNQHDHRNAPNRKRQFNDRPARQVTTNKLAKTNVVNIVNDSNHSSDVNIEPTNNLNE